jgi:hypothetical protein
MSENKEKLGDYERFESVFARSLTEAWEVYEGDGGTKFMNAWRDTWTQKNHKNIRELKETANLEKQQALADIFERYQKELKERGEWERQSANE